jgi:hypothetical protein
MKILRQLGWGAGNPEDFDYISTEYKPIQKVVSIVFCVSAIRRRSATQQVP